VIRKAEKKEQKATKFDMNERSEWLYAAAKVVLVTAIAIVVVSVGNAYFS
jgi:hypothetical protein